LVINGSHHQHALILYRPRPAAGLRALPPERAGAQILRARLIRLCCDHAGRERSYEVHRIRYAAPILPKLHQQKPITRIF
jgi:hypothetical protein